MIKITFTCEICGAVEEIDYNALEKKRIVPVCNKCYTAFVKKKERIKSSIVKLYSHYHIDCPDMDFYLSK